MKCFECGKEMTFNENGVSNHIYDGGGIDYDSDADHVAYNPECLSHPDVRRVEYYRLWNGNGNDTGTWDTGFIYIPANTPEDQIESAVRVAAESFTWSGDPPLFVGLYSSSEPLNDDGR